jgi:hypothetical protein
LIKILIFTEKHNDTLYTYIKGIFNFTLPPFDKFNLSLLIVAHFSFMVSSFLLLVPASVFIEIAHQLHVTCGLEIVADKTIVGIVSCALNNKR